MSSREELEPIARRFATERGVDPDIFVRLITQESNWDPQARNPTSGAFGLGQFVPRWYPDAPSWSPEEQLRKAVSILFSNLAAFGWDYPLAVAAYNAGVTAMERWRTAYGDGWRAALTLYGSEWERIAVYQTTDKAAEVAHYLDKILGPEAPVSVQPPDGIEWIGTPHFTEGREGRQPIALINHVAEGALGSVDNWFNDPASQVSAHFCVGKAGQIHQYVSTRNTAWANGRLNRPDTSIDWIARCVRERINPNSVTISIEREGYSSQAPTEPQYQSILALHRYCIAAYNIPVNAQHITGHRSLDSVDRPNCPGNFPWDRLFRDLRGGSAPQPAPESLKVTPSQALDEIWRIASIVEGGQAGEPEAQTLRRMVATIKDGL